MDGELNFAKACSGWAFWLGFSLGVKMSLDGSQAYVGYCGDIGYFKSLPEGKKERGEEAWKQRSSLLPLQNSSVGAVGYSNPFQAAKS